MTQTFPDARWGSEHSWLRKPAVTFASTRLGSRLIRSLTPLDRKILQRSNGRRTLLGPLGLPTLLLTTIGRKSGQPRTSPLLYIRDGERLVVVGSNFGQATHPAWTNNLLANPAADVALGGKIIPVRAMPVLGQERERLYAQFIEMAALYEAYRHRTTRAIRMFTLEADTD